MASGTEPRPSESFFAEIFDMNICADANNINTIGYTFTRVNENTLNTPSKEDASYPTSGCIFQYTPNNYFNVQVYFPLSYNALFIRYQNAGVWNSWVKIS